MKAGNYLNVLGTKIFAVLWSVIIGFTLVGELLGRHFWQRPLTMSEMVVLGLSILGAWLIYRATRWWTGFLDERGF